MHGYESISSYGFYCYGLAFKERRGRDARPSPAVASCDVSLSRPETKDSQLPFK